ncbi:MAG: 3-deoxy-manno-octulosonate cytidylyltransferase [Pedobacter sp.]|nr:3-deoxy-manno-octulosonate cytidylyltransferase [Pedobacter sp.]
MKILGIIPARFASTRFPGKPLAQIRGKSMIQRVYEQAAKSTLLADVIVATDDGSIAEEVTRFGGKFVMTASTHISGTDRCAEVINKLSGFDSVVNIQGDEPFIDPSQIDLLASCFDDHNVQIATLIKRVDNQEDLFNENIPKVILNDLDEAIYFSRQTIPFLRNVLKTDWLEKGTFFKHIGIYGYTVTALQHITKLKPSSLELAESLEQLRWIEAGYKVKTRKTAIETIAIDTPEDLIKINGL